jgi:putative transposase
LALLEDQSIELIVMEYTHRLIRYGSRSLDALFNALGRAVEVASQAENGTEDLLAVFTAGVYSFCAGSMASDGRSARRRSSYASWRRKGTTMRLVEQHVIKRADRRFKAAQSAAFASKSLYNKALYVTRQAFFRDGLFPSYSTLYHAMKGEPESECVALPRKVAQWALKQACAVRDSYRAALAARDESPARFSDRPCNPRYKQKQQGRHWLVDTRQVLSRPVLRNRMFCPTGLGITVQIRHSDVQQICIISAIGFYIVAVLYEGEPIQAAVNPSLYAGIDIGPSNLAPLTSNRMGFVPQFVNGRPVRSIDQYCNKRRAGSQNQPGMVGTIRRLERIAAKRTRRIDWFLHTASRHLTDDLLVAVGIGTLCIGKHPLWKQDVNMRRRNNQNVVSVPHVRIIEMLICKVELVGIQVHNTGEIYTNKASFLDADVLPISDLAHLAPTFSGRRAKCGLCRAADEWHINADANDSSNTTFNVAPDAFAQGSRGCLVRPVRLAV